MPLSARAELHAVRHADLRTRQLKIASTGIDVRSAWRIWTSDADVNEHWLEKATKTTCRCKTTRRPQASMSNPTPLSPLVTVRAGT